MKGSKDDTGGRVDVLNFYVWERQEGGLGFPHTQRGNRTVVGVLTAGGGVPVPNFWTNEVNVCYGAKLIGAAGKYVCCYGSGSVLFVVVVVGDDDDDDVTKMSWVL